MAPTRSLALTNVTAQNSPNVDVLSLFRQVTCSASASIHYNSLKVHSYGDSPKIDCSSSSSSSVQTVYCKTGIRNCSNSFTKIIYTGAYKILDAQYLHTFSQCHQTQGLQLSFRHHFLVWSRAEHVMLVLCSFRLQCTLPCYECCVIIFGYVAPLCPFL